MKVSICHVPIWTTQSPPLAPAYLAATLAANGHDATIFDMNAEVFHRLNDHGKELWSRAYLHAWHVEEPFYRQIAPATLYPYLAEYTDKMLAGGVRLVAISVCSPWYAIEVARAIKERDRTVQVIVGGQCCEKDWFGLMLANCGAVDAVAIGEGEVTLMKMLDAVIATGKVAPCPGALVWHDGQLVDGGPAELLPDLNEIPLPIYPGIDLDNYWWEGQRAAEGHRTFSLLGTRGCVRHCDFCLQQTIWGSKHRLRSPENIADEIELRVKQGATYLFFNDLLVNGNPRDLRVLCEILIDRGIKVPMSGSFIVTRKMTRDYIATLLKAGFSHFDFGMEHISAKVLKAMGKYYDEALVKEVLENCKAENADWSSSWIVGYPEEDSDDFLMVVRFLLENRHLIPRAPSFSLCAVLPGSDLWRKREQLQITINGQDSMSWYLADGTNTLPIRRERGELVQMILNLLWDKALPITGSMSDDRICSDINVQKVVGLNFTRAIERLDTRINELARLRKWKSLGIIGETLAHNRANAELTATELDIMLTELRGTRELMEKARIERYGGIAESDLKRPAKAGPAIGLQSDR